MTAETDRDLHVLALNSGSSSLKFGLYRIHAAVRILYGGSVKPDNAQAILALPQVGGALVGGASLEAIEFEAIVRAVP